MNNKKCLFISGLHRSGTSILHQVLSRQDDISGFRNTGVPHDEGQHLQTVYKTAKFYGGPGRFAFNAGARLNETSDLVNESNRIKLLDEWSSYWDMSKSILVEKSPPNLIRTRFLQAFFPDSYFVTIIRHPIAVSLSTQKWPKVSMVPLEELIRHWLLAYKIYFDDSKHLKNKIFFSYEEMVAQPEKVLLMVGKLIGSEIRYNEDFRNENEKYFKNWNLLKCHDRKGIIKTLEAKINQFGYSFIDLDRYASAEKQRENI